MADKLLSDFVWLAERACRPLSAKSSLAGFDYVYSLTSWRRNQLEDLEYLHQMASDQWLDYLNQSCPLYFETSARKAVEMVSGWKELAEDA
jgi:hypothetical protein